MCERAVYFGLRRFSFGGLISCRLAMEDSALKLLLSIRRSSIVWYAYLGIGLRVKYRIDLKGEAFGRE